MRKTRNLTKIHKALKIKPQTALELQDLYPEMDKSVIYRTLQRMGEEKMLFEIMLDNGQISYELKNSSHHHHVICQKCKEVFCIDLPRQLSDEISYFEKKLSEKFEVRSHRIDFFVLCKKCQ